MMNKRKALDKNTPKGALVQQLEQTQAPRPVSTLG